MHPTLASSQLGEGWIVLAAQPETGLNRCTCKYLPLPSLHRVSRLPWVSSLDILIPSKLLLLSIQSFHWLKLAPWPISSSLQLIWAALCIEKCLNVHTDSYMQTHLHEQFFWHIALISDEPLLILRASSRCPSCIPLASSGRCTPSYAHICST